jgi:hypothetical protein
MKDLMYDDPFTQSFLKIMRRRLKEHEAKYPMQMVRLKAEVLAASAAYREAATDDARDRAIEREDLAVAGLLTARPTLTARTNG